MFEEAVRRKFRFESPKGLLTTEDLWDLPLISSRGVTVSLDDIAKNVNRQLKETSEESFVSPTNNSKAQLLQSKLDILKHIISVKLRERDEIAAASRRQSEKARLYELLEKKELQELEGLSKEDIQKKIAELA